MDETKKYYQDNKKADAITDEYYRLQALKIEESKVKTKADEIREYLKKSTK